MESVVATFALLVLMVLALGALARAWVRSSQSAGYRVEHGADGIEREPQVPEDDEARWSWRDREPKP
jgi:hypothetical protein